MHVVLTEDMLWACGAGSPASYVVRVHVPGVKLGPRAGCSCEGCGAGPSGAHAFSLVVSSPIFGRERPTRSKEPLVKIVQTHRA